MCRRSFYEHIRADLTGLSLGSVSEQGSFYDSLGTDTQSSGPPLIPGGRLSLYLVDKGKILYKHLAFLS